nr:retrovirus-related Pol polyprotein from transposon TNT 1-94 [Tanacetum cinerariifolium]
MSSLTPNGARFFAKASESVNWLWHKRISHLNFKNINKLAKQNKVLGLPSLVYSKDKPCTTCEKEKYHRASFKTKQNFAIRKCFHLLHMDLFGPVSPMSIKHAKYTLVIVDEYSRTDNGTEFRNHKFESFCDEKGISQNFSSPYKPEQNGNNTEVSGAINEPLVPDVTQPHIPNHASTSSHPAPQDRWSRDQHIKLVNIIGNPGEGMLTRSMAAKLTATSASECLFANFLFEIEHKKSAAMSSAEAEYVVDAGCYASILWMKSQLSDYDIYYKMTNNVVVVYQNFLKEFWSTVVAFDPFSSTDEPEKCPLKEFLIKFSVSNRQRPLTLDFQTFCSSTGLDYNNGKYVEHPTPKVVKKELGKIAINPSYLDKTLVLKNSFPVAWRILDSVSLPPLAAKPRKGKSQTVTSISPQS